MLGGMDDYETWKKMVSKVGKSLKENAELVNFVTILILVNVGKSGGW